MLMKYIPGIGLTLAIGLVAILLQSIEAQLLGHAILEGLVLAIMLGMLWRAMRGIGIASAPGIRFMAKDILEGAIVLLGASVDVASVLRAGPALLLAIVLVVTLGISVSSLIGRMLGLNAKLAALVAVGNAICGNSAIAALAPVIDASAEDVASAIALTAVLGVGVVLSLPLLIPILGFSLYQYGILAGMTVYAVPQVLAATFPVSIVSGQVGTMVKLMRVLLLGPVVLFFGLRFAKPEQGARIALTQYVPWFIIGFVVFASIRSFGLLPTPVVDVLRSISAWLTVMAMAALGLGVDLHAVRRVGRPVAAAVIGSLCVLIMSSIVLIRLLAL